MTNGRQQQQQESSKEGKSDYVNEYENFTLLLRPWKPFKSEWLTKLKLKREFFLSMWHSANVFDFAWFCVWEIALCTLCRLSVLKVFSFVKWLFTFPLPHQPETRGTSTTCLWCLNFLSLAWHRDELSTEKIFSWIMNVNERQIISTFLMTLYNSILRHPLEDVWIFPLLPPPTDNIQNVIISRHTAAQICQIVLFVVFDFTRLEKIMRKFSFSCILDNKYADDDDNVRNQIKLRTKLFDVSRVGVCTEYQSLDDWTEYEKK